MTINDRVKEARKALELTQIEFGDKVGISQGHLTSIESGKRAVTEKTIIVLCATFGISESWLRTGTGEMFIESDSTIVSQLSDEYGLDAFEKAMISGFISMKPEQRAMLKEWVKFSMCKVFDDEQAYKEFREEYDKGRALPFAARGGDVSGLAEAADLYDNAPPDDESGGDGNDGM